MLLQAPWLLMIETDYVWMKPLVAPMAESSALSIAFPFGYIQPTAPAITGVMRKMYPESKGPLKDVPNSGPAPVLMRWQELFKVTGTAACVTNPQAASKLLGLSAFKNSSERYWVLPVQIAPDWERLTAHIENDPESKKQLGWVREMYAWSVGAALQVCTSVSPTRNPVYLPLVVLAIPELIG